MAMRQFLTRNREFFYKHTKINYVSDTFDTSIIASRLLKWFDRLSRNSQLMKDFFRSVTECEYEEVVIKFFYNVPQKNISLSIVNMFTQFDKKYFIKEYLKYIEACKKYYQKRYIHMTELTDYSQINAEMVKQINLIGRKMNSVIFTNDKVANRRLMNEINDMNGFVIRTAAFYSRYKILSCSYSRFFIHVTVNMRIRREKEREFQKKQKNIIKCELLSEKLPMDICLHVICNYL